MDVEMENIEENMNVDSESESETQPSPCQSPVGIITNPNEESWNEFLDGFPALGTEEIQEPDLNDPEDPFLGHDMHILNNTISNTSTHLAIFRRHGMIQSQEEIGFEQTILTSRKYYYHILRYQTSYGI